MATQGQLQLIPEKSTFNPRTDIVSAHICREPNCRGEGFNTSIFDLNQHLLRGNLTKNTVSLHELYCRNEVLLVAQGSGEEDEPVRRKITLHPTEQLHCSQKDIYLTPASALKPIPYANSSLPS
ncbi:unnamed protein product [Schistocephalus solidus]|uniref:Uncharacterized protein n=1 Tax=Schistocephalus solidus TaxID=70667 RepID=A0A183SD64_SCHSO|nr:unnamed protein product [Schistocephalus solidus]